jgi:hypothetical protein
MAKLSKRKAPGLLNKVYARASREATSGGARATLRIAVQVGQLVTTIKPRMMIVTYEGHAWERAAFSAARDASASVLCVGYQHAAIFRLQHGALRKLGPKFDPNVILTAGHASKEQIKRVMKAPTIPMHVLGSNRADEVRTGGLRADDIASSCTTNARNMCLVLPEGIVSECLRLFEFSLDCAKLMPEMLFIWRLHPLVTFESLMAQRPLFKKIPRNVTLSTAAMDDDIARASYALYRGSTAIVKAVCANVRPVYLAFPNEMTIDPLYELIGWRESVSNPKEFFSVVNRRPLAAEGSEAQISAIRYCTDFFTPLDPSAVLTLFN